MRVAAAGTGATFGEPGGWSRGPPGSPLRMPNPEQLGGAGLVGWRKAVADGVAPRAARRAPISEEQARAIIGAAFFLLSAYYVVSTTVRIVKAARS